MRILPLITLSLLFAGCTGAPVDMTTDAELPAPVEETATAGGYRQASHDRDLSDVYASACPTGPAVGAGSYANPIIEDAGYVEGDRSLSIALTWEQPADVLLDLVVQVIAPGAEDLYAEHWFTQSGDEWRLDANALQDLPTGFDLAIRGHGDSCGALPAHAAVHHETSVQVTLTWNTGDALPA